jgi:molybdate transport repressor ModE-like protein
MFDWNDLRHFLAVARAGSMATAARTLGVNSSTVQRRIAALEKAIGRQLVERSPHGYALTAQGQALLSEAATVEDAMYTLHRRLAALDGSAQGRVRLTSLVTIGQRIIKSGLLERFQALHPGITVELVMEQRIADLAKGEADIAIRGGGAGSDTLVGLKIADLPWGVFASRAFVARYGRPSHVGDLGRFAIIELTDELESVPAARWMKAHSNPANVAARCGNIPGAVLAVKAGAGLAPLPSVHAAEDDDLVCILDASPAHSYPIYLFAHKDLRKVPRIDAVFRFCSRELKSVLLPRASAKR